MNSSVTARLLPVAIIMASTFAEAVPEIPAESGWSGHINLGVGGGTSETNMLASISSIDLGDDTISSLDEDAGSEDIALPVLQFEAAYTLGESRTQFYLANQEADSLNFDLENTLQTNIGIRQGITGVGRVDFSLSATPIPIDVWKDPYLVDESRGDTERTSSGIRIAWDQIFDAPLEVVWISKEIELDDERSGESLPLSRDDQRKLRREGNVNRININYTFDLNDRHSLVPGVGYVDLDLDGEAMAEDGYSAHLKHVYNRGRWRLLSRIYYRDTESGGTNPIYNDDEEVEAFGASSTFFYSDPLGFKGWVANVTAAWYEEDSNIDFYDSTLGLVSFGMFYRFK